jgi:hypothetical protein
VLVVWIVCLGLGIAIGLESAQPQIV